MELQIQQWLRNQAYRESSLSTYNIRTMCQAWLTSQACQQKEAFVIKALLELIARPESTSLSIKSHLHTIYSMLTLPDVWADDVEEDVDTKEDIGCVVH